MRRWTLFAVGLAASVAVTALLWWAGLPGAALFLLFPFLWLPRGRRAGPTRRCPACGYASDEPDVRFCPRDGTPLA